MHLLSAFQVLEVHFVVGRVRESRLAHNSVYAVELFSSLRGVVSVAQNHTIIYLQQLYRLFITGSLLTQKGEARATRSLSAALVLSLSLSPRKIMARASVRMPTENLISPFLDGGTFTVELHSPISLRHSAVTVRIGSASCRRTVVQCALSSVYVFPIPCRSTI